MRRIMKIIKKINRTNLFTIKTNSSMRDQNIIAKAIATKIADTTCTSTSLEYVWKSSKQDLKSVYLLDQVKQISKKVCNNLLKSV